MASHHYPHHHQLHHYAATSGAVCHGCCPPPAPEPYLPHYHHHFYNTPHPNTPIPNPAPPPFNGHHHHAPPNGSHNEPHSPQQQPPRDGQDPPESALLRRIAALESSLRRDQSPKRARSLRDTAARTIQTHFRAFLVRRSRTLRQLKELASIKSTLNALKSSVSDSARLNPIFVSHKASRLLFKLDLVQGCDPMIRDGKKSIRRELTRFLDLINGFTEKTTVNSTRLVKKNAVPKKSDHSHSRRQCQDVGDNKMLEELANRVEALYDKLPKQGDGVEKTADCREIPTVKRILNSRSEAEAKAEGKKSVRFADLVSMEEDDEDEDSDDCEDEVKDNLTRNAEEVEGFSFAVTEDDDDDEGEGAIGYAVRREDGSLVFPAMDPRRKTVK